MTDVPPPPPPVPPSTPMTPAGWYAAPGDPMSWRYWDGIAWTSHTAPRVNPSFEPTPTPPAWLVPHNVSGWAVASGYLGLVSLIFLGTPGPFAVITGVLAPFTQHDLDHIAAELNGRPRQTLGWMSPSQALNQLLR